MGSQLTPQLPPVFRIATAYWASQAVYVAAKLGIADVLSVRPKSCDEIASATHADSESLLRLMRALVGLGVLAIDDDGRFCLTAIGAPLRTGMAGSMRSMVLTLGEEHYQAWGKLLDSIQNGGPAFNSAFHQPLFEYLRGNPAAAHTFDDAMSDFTSQVALAAVLAYDFSAVHVAVDIGGGRGTLLGTILQFNPSMTGILFDLEHVVKSAHPYLEADGVRGRCRTVAGDFFESIPPGADAYLLKNVLHDWDDDHAITILKNCRGAMDLGGMLLVIEIVLPVPNEEALGSLLDLNMLVISGGRERTEAEYRRLFEASGFRLKRFIPTVALVSILEAAPV
jgi:hypothetical protein